jgi:tRNA nucleotidyltransferase (CCA-adding enzyme)
MEAGQVTVKPEDSIEHLQRLMTESGWGQVPVIHPETGEIIGIVTRTDLLKTLTSGAKMTSRQTLAARLEKVLPPARMALIRVIAAEAHELHAAVYIVGGFVRDLMLERPSQDFDLVVEGDAIGLAYNLSRRYGGRVTSHARFGTAKWFLGEIRHLNGDQDPVDLPPFIDLITARTEFYTHPTALPTVERGSIKLDLHRRDFTINTLALRLDGRHYGELHDYWGGLNDLRLGLVRCLHSLSFVDDPTRMLRAVRFEQRFSFAIEERTLQLLREAISLLGRVSGDRVRHELDHILDEEHAASMLMRLDALGLLAAIHPGLAWDEWLEGRLKVWSQKSAGLNWQVWEGNETASSLRTKEPVTQVDRPASAGQDPARKLWNGMPRKRVLAYTLWLIRITEKWVNEVLVRLKTSGPLEEVILAAFALWRDMDSLLDLQASLSNGWTDCPHSPWLGFTWPVKSRAKKTCFSVIWLIGVK